MRLDRLNENASPNVVLNPVFKHSDRRVVVLNARERVACYRRKSREPVIGQRKAIGRVEVIGAHIRWANIGFEIRLRLVIGGNGCVEGKPCREIMRERQGEVCVHVVVGRVCRIVGVFVALK